MLLQTLNCIKFLRRPRGSEGEKRKSYTEAEGLISFVISESWDDWDEGGGGGGRGEWMLTHTLREMLRYKKK